jgi:flagellar export protein FliJ
MKRFRFRLDRLLHLREAERRQEEVALAREQQLVNAREEELAASHREFGRSQGAHRDLMNSATSSELLMTGQFALDAAEGRIAACGEALRLAQEAFEVVRERLIERSQAVDILDRLRRKRRQEHDLVEGRADQNRIDAMAVQQYAINSSAPIS